MFSISLNIPHTAGADTVSYPRAHASNVLLINVQTTSTLETFFLAMTLHPNILQEAQRSVDHICDGRLPDFSDYDTLPWIHAIVMECLRWRPPSPMGLSLPSPIQAVWILTAAQTVLAHMLTKDDIYEGYHIPKGSLVFASAWYASCASNRFH